MKIIEKYIQGKKGNLSECEDGLVITDKLVAVIDGVTAKGEKIFDSLTSGAFARKILSETLSKEGIDKLNAEELFSKLSQVLKGSAEMFYDNIEYTDYPRAAVIVFNSLYNEIWCYGDCQCIINSELFSHEKDIDKLTSKLRAFYLEKALLDGDSEDDFYTEDIGRKKIMDVLKSQLSFENKNIPFGYPILNGFDINSDMIVKYKVVAGDEVILSSDGYPFLENSLEKSEEKLSYLLRNDPHCFRIYKTTKGINKENLSFDDRCYCKFIV